MHVAWPIVLCVVCALAAGCGGDFSPPAPSSSAGGRAGNDWKNGPGFFQRLEKRNPAAESLRALTGARTRVVWTQDAADNTDVFSERSRQILMGFDTEDGRGERAILAEPSNYVKPMIMPGGDRVIYTDRPHMKMYIVNWDGSNRRFFADGMALQPWKDATTGAEWVYVGLDPRQGRRGKPYHMVRRLRVDNPQISEPVWDRAPVTEDFHVSADGRFAGSTFPWPDCGVADLQAGAWTRFGSGCWTAMGPANIGLFWIFDGAHRNLLLFDLQGRRKSIVNVNSAPGMDGFEVYHPRWSNHPRFITLTGPYKVGSGSNRIRGAGDEVEIFVGRFDDNFTAIEAWTQVTHNRRLDVTPDVWVEYEPPVEVSAPSAETPAHAQATWPGRRDGLVYAWENRSRNNEIVDPETRSVFICQAEPRGLARYGRYFDMDLTGGYFEADDAGPRILAACRASGEIAIEAQITPSSPAASGRIVTCDNLFALYQEGESLFFRWLHSNAAPAKTATLKAGSPLHVIVSYNEGRLNAFVNGEPMVAQDHEPLDFARVSNEGKLAMGDGHWPGLLEGIALYSRAIDQREASEKYTMASRRMASRQAPPPLVMTARLMETSSIPTPESIAPYRRALVVNKYKVLHVEEGNYDRDEIMAAHWAILDGVVLDTAARAVGKDYRMIVEPYAQRPELEGERLAMDSDAFDLPLYFDTNL